MNRITKARVTGLVSGPRARAGLRVEFLVTDLDLLLALEGKRNQNRLSLKTTGHRAFRVPVEPESVVFGDVSLKAVKFFGRVLWWKASALLEYREGVSLLPDEKHPSRVGFQKLSESMVFP